ncbi:MAG TPA: competence/damage-inducible protein A [Bacteroidales bacterium]|nr:competence/damage-inducible protein A [Bacteroidales bacterium]
MKAAIVTIGDEILIGQITDTNSVWIAKELISNGISIKEMVSIPDTPEAIETTLDRFIGTVDILLLTGGLGPTKDDLTKQTLASYFGAKMEMNDDALKAIKAFFEKRGRNLLETNRMQALVPDNCQVIPNNHGTAPGMWFEKDSTHVISMPGVPYEMKPMVREAVIPGLKDRLEIPEIYHKTVMTHGVPESYLAEIIKDWEQNLPECLKLAYLPRPGIVRLRLTALGECAKNPEETIEAQIDLLKQVIPEHIFGYNDVLLEKAVGLLMREQSLTLSTAESCTGGNIARLLTSISGSSDYFHGSVVAYSNEIKTSILEVSAKDIEDYGAVSEQVVQAMAKGVMGKFKTDLSIAVSGIAGPDGGTDEKPVGTVWIAVANRSRIISRKFVFGGHRELVIEQSSIVALGLLRKLLINTDQ